MVKKKILKAEEETVLFAAWRENKDRQARDKIIEFNQGLVRTIANDYRYSGLDFDDLVSEGNIGLMRAIEKFDYKRGYKFSTYAIWWVRQAVGRYVKNNNRVIRLPVHVGDKITKINKFSREFEANNGIAPSAKDIAEGIGMSEEDVEGYINASASVVSMQSQVGEDGSELGEFIPSEEPSLEDIAENQARDRTLHLAVIKLLTEKERFVIVRRFGLFGSDIYTLEEIGSMLGVTRERIRQIESTSLRKIKRGFAGIKAA